MSEQLLQAHRKAMRRCKRIAFTHPDSDDIVQFCETSETIENTDKLSRWVGFAQGVLISRGHTSLEIERNFARNLYKPIYDELGLDSETI